MTMTTCRPTGIWRCGRSAGFSQTPGGPKGKGQELRYIYVTEGNCPGGRLHHHVVINGTGDDADDLKRLWIYGDNVKFKAMRFTASDTYEDLASYLTKEPREHGHPEVGNGPGRRPSGWPGRRSRRWRPCRIM